MRRARRERRGARPWVTLDFNSEDLVLPRPFLSIDGDLDGRALLMLGVNVGTAHGDPWFAFGVDFRANPGSPGWRLAESLDLRLERTHGTWRPLG